MYLLSGYYSTTTLLTTPFDGGPEAVINHFGRTYPDLVLPHPKHPPEASDHRLGSVIGGSLVPRISPQSWQYVEPSWRAALTAFLADNAPPLTAAAGAEEPPATEPALVPQSAAAQITACLGLPGARSFSAVFAAVGRADVDTLASWSL